MAKKRIKILKVDECFQCARHFFVMDNYETGDREHYCDLSGRIVRDPFTIPGWCKLEDYRED